MYINQLFLYILHIELFTYTIDYRTRYLTTSPLGDVIEPMKSEPAARDVMRREGDGGDGYYDPKWWLPTLGSMFGEKETRKRVIVLVAMNI